MKNFWLANFGRGGGGNLTMMASGWGLGSLIYGSLPLWLSTGAPLRSIPNSRWHMRIWARCTAIGALAHLQIGRAFASAGDKTRAKKSYQDFLTLWKDADSDIPILKQAKSRIQSIEVRNRINDQLN